MLKRFSSDNVEVPCKWALQWRFLKRGRVNIEFWFGDPEKAHPSAEPRLLRYFASTSVVTSCLWVGLTSIKNQK